MDAAEKSTVRACQNRKSRATFLKEPGRRESPPPSSSKRGRSPVSTWSKPAAAAEQAARRIPDASIGEDATGRAPDLARTAAGLAWTARSLEVGAGFAQAAKGRAVEKRVECRRFTVIERPRQPKRKIQCAARARRVLVFGKPARSAGSLARRPPVRPFPGFQFLVSSESEKFLRSRQIHITRPTS